MSPHKPSKHPLEDKPHCAKFTSHFIWEAETDGVGCADEELRRYGDPVLHVGVDALSQAGQRDEALDEGPREGQAGRGQDGPPQADLDLH